MTKLLYVEDNDDNIYMLKMRLDLLGDFEVLTAENGERGCEVPPQRSVEKSFTCNQLRFVDRFGAAGNGPSRERFTN